MNKKIIKFKGNINSIIISIIVLCSYILRAQDYTTGLILDLPMNGNVVPNTGSYSFTNNNATLTSDRFGTVGMAYRFNGTSSFISTTDFTVPTTNLTVSFWINMLATNSEGLSVFLAGANTYFYVILRNTNNTVNSYKSSTTNPFASDNVGTITNTQIVGQGWKHIVVTFTSNSVSYYLNGTQVGTTSTSNIGTLDNTSNNFVIGAYNNSTTANHFYFNGDLDEVRVYNRTLSSLDVSSLYSFQNTGSGGTPPPVPTGLSITSPTTTSLTASWTASSGATSYTVQYSTSSTFTTSTTISPNPTSTSQVVSGLTPGTTYYFRVNANNVNGSSAYSTIASGITATSGGSSQWTTSGTGIFYSADVHVGKGNTNKGPEVGYSLYVSNGIKTEKIKVELPATGGWADHIFNNDYHLLPIKQVERFIISNQHLPGFPSEKTIIKDGGYEISDMMKRQQVGIESLYLYIIELEKKVEMMNVLEKRMKELEKKINK